MSLTEIKQKLIEFYLAIKIRKITDINSITKEKIQKEKQCLNKLSILEIINYISSTIDTLIEMKANEKLEEKYEKDSLNKKYKNPDPNDENGLILYEGMLIKLERDIRNHIKVRKIFFILCILYIQIEQQLKLRIEELEFEIDELKRINNSKNSFYCKVNTEKNQKYYLNDQKNSGKKNEASININNNNFILSLSHNKTKLIVHNNTNTFSSKEHSSIKNSNSNTTLINKRKKENGCSSNINFDYVKNNTINQTSYKKKQINNINRVNKIICKKFIIDKKIEKKNLNINTMSSFYNTKSTANTNSLSKYKFLKTISNSNNINDNLLNKRLLNKIQPRIKCREFLFNEEIKEKNKKNNYMDQSKKKLGIKNTNNSSIKLLNNGIAIKNIEVKKNNINIDNKYHENSISHQNTEQNKKKKLKLIKDYNQNRIRINRKKELPHRCNSNQSNHQRNEKQKSFYHLSKNKVFRTHKATNTALYEHKSINRHLIIENLNKQQKSQNNLPNVITTIRNNPFNLMKNVDKKRNSRRKINTSESAFLLNNNNQTYSLNEK